MTLELLLSIPKSMYVNLRLLSFQEAIKMPIIVRYNDKLSCLTGRIIMNNTKVRTAMLRIGFGDIGVLDKRFERTILNLKGVLSISNDAFIGQGARISIGKSAKLHLGNNFRNSGGMTLMCEENIAFGDDCLVSWNTTIMDSDYHSTINLANESIKAKSAPIKIGNRVWLGLGSMILKNTIVADGCVIAASTVVTKSFLTPNTLLVGAPAVEKLHNITRYID